MSGLRVAAFTKVAGDHIITELRDENGDLKTECTCGRMVIGHQDRPAARAWVYSHYRFHTVKAVR